VGKKLGLATGGYAPRGWRTDDGPAPWLADYGLKEHESSSYPGRTEENIRASDGTILFGYALSPGSILTRRLCEQLECPLILVSWPKSLTDSEDEDHRVLRVQRWLLEHNVKILNNAGNRERRAPGIGKAYEAFLYKVLAKD
jgi:hypothetical protein